MMRTIRIEEDLQYLRGYEQQILDIMDLSKDLSTQYGDIPQGVYPPISYPWLREELGKVRQKIVARRLMLAGYN